MPPPPGTYHPHRNVGPAGVALTDTVQVKLRQFLGADYVDRSLAQVSWVLGAGC